MWSDMAIETTYMRYGHGHCGIIGLTLQEDLVKIWAYSMQACNRITSSVDDLRDRKMQDEKTHKEEGAGRMARDAVDRKALREKLDMSISPLQERDDNALVNIATGEIVSHPSVNVAEAVTLGEEELSRFRARCPHGFHEPIKKVVTTMDAAKKHIKVNKSKIIDPEVIYARAMAVHSSSRQFDPEHLLSYELAPIPTSMFTVQGMRSTDKSVLKSKLQMKVASQLDYDAIFIDGCALVWTVQWPSGKTVQDFLEAFLKKNLGHFSGDAQFISFSTGKSIDWLRNT
jgi:hypothetical protein